MMNKARREFYKNVIDENSSDQDMLSRATRKLLKQDIDVPYPQHDDTRQLANEMGTIFFTQKIINIRSRLESRALTGFSLQPETEAGESNMLPVESCFDEFQPLSEEDVKALVSKSQKKTIVR